MNRPQEDLHPSRTKINQPKGTRLRDDLMIEKLNYLVKKLTSTLIRLNYKERDYPVMDYENRLLDKYGDDEKLIYKMKDKYQENPLVLRYDLTTQHMIYSNPHYRTKTFQCGKVYRNEPISNTQHRYREFYQFDCDVVAYPTQFSYQEILTTLGTCLKVLDLDRVCKIRINDRKQVNQWLREADVPEESIHTVCSTLDKLDKVEGDWEKLRPSLNDKVGATVATKVIDTFKSVTVHPCCDMKTVSGISLEWDPTMIRGLNYYTGLIFEVVCGEITIGGGGEYQTSVGFSLGLDRILDLPYTSVESTFVSVYLITWIDECTSHAQEIIPELLQLNPTWCIQIYPISSGRQLKNHLAKLNKRERGMAFVYGPSEMAEGLNMVNAMGLGGYVPNFK